MNLRIQKALAASIVAAMVSASGIAEATPLNLDIGASKDSFLRYRRHNINEGANEILVVRPSVANRPVVGFDLTSVNAAGVTSARLVLNVKRNRKHWGRSGQTVDVHPLLADFDEGNGKTFMVFPGQRRGTGAGVTWECASDANIANTRTDCDPQWNGGTVGPATDSFLHLNTTTGEVSFDVTADVKAGRSSWLLKKTDENQPGRVDYYSREGAAAAGNAALAPRLVIAGCTPSAELCDGQDNDCDGNVDNGNPGGGQTCNTGLLGVCVAGTTACSNGSIACNQNVQSSAEACDGLDNDCNGEVDNGLGQTMCGVGACMRTVDNCLNGAAQTCIEGMPTAEVCSDGLDNDCDGTTDAADSDCGPVVCPCFNATSLAQGIASCGTRQIRCLDTVFPGDVEFISLICTDPAIGTIYNAGAVYNLVNPSQPRNCTQVPPTVLPVQTTKQQHDACRDLLRAKMQEPSVCDLVQ
jgi:Putative metal-binding motif